MTRGYVTVGKACLIVFLLLTAVLLAEFKWLMITHVIGAGKNADDQLIDRESDMCVIRVTAPCGDDICRYKASVPCAELNALVKASKGGK